MRIAFLGTRGIPAQYGGSETAVENISKRLQSKGHEIIVFGISNNYKFERKNYEGIKLINLPTFPIKFLDFPFRGFLSSIISLTQKCDILHFFGPETGVYSLLPRIAGKKIVTTLDGLAWERASYSKTIRQLVKIAFKITTKIGGKILVDSKNIQQWIYENMKVKAEYISYGAILSDSKDLTILKKLNLEENSYYLFVGRLVKEKNVELLIEAFNKLQTEKKLVIVGKSHFSDDYENYLKEIANKNVIFLGTRYGKEYEEITKSAYCYVTASKLEGSSPSLIQAMGYGCPVIVSDIPNNIEVIGDCGLSFENGNVVDLKAKMEYLENNDQVASTLSVKAKERVQKRYSWDKIVNDLEIIYEELIS